MADATSCAVMRMAGSQGRLQPGASVGPRCRTGVGPEAAAVAAAAAAAAAGPVAAAVRSSPMSIAS